MFDPSLRIRVDFGTVLSVGPGKIALLHAVNRSGSLAQAARELGMSYRHAWSLLGDLNRAFHEPAVAFIVGGREGGSASLTVTGKQLLSCYDALEKVLTCRAQRCFAPLRRKFAAPHAAPESAKPKPLRKRLRKPLSGKARATAAKRP